MPARAAAATSPPPPPPAAAAECMAPRSDTIAVSASAASAACASAGASSSTASGARRADRRWMIRVSSGGGGGAAAPPVSATRPRHRPPAPPSAKEDVGRGAAARPLRGAHRAGVRASVSVTTTRDWGEGRGGIGKRERVRCLRAENEDATSLATASLPSHTRTHLQRRRDVVGHRIRRSKRPALRSVAASLRVCIVAAATRGQGVVARGRGCDCSGSSSRGRLRGRVGEMGPRRREQRPTQSLAAWLQHAR